MDSYRQYPAFQFFQQQNSVFSGLAAEATVELNLSRGQAPERIYGALVSANYFSVLGVEAALGRTFLPEENSAPGAHPVAVLSHRFWHSAWGGDPGVVGRSLILNNQRLIIVGVAPEGFAGSSALLTPQVWIPAMMQPQMWPGPNRLSAQSLPSTSSDGSRKGSNALRPMPPCRPSTCNSGKNGVSKLVQIK